MFDKRTAPSVAGGGGEQQERMGGSGRPPVIGVAEWRALLLKFEGVHPWADLFDFPA